MADRSQDHGASLPPPTTDKRYREVLNVANRVAKAKYGGWSDAAREDLVSEVMIKYWQKFGRGSGPDNTRAWLSGVISTTAIDMNRAKEARPSVAVGDPAVDIEPTAVASVDEFFRVIQKSGPSKAVASGELVGSVLRLIDQRESDLITWKYLDRLPTRAIANRLEMSEPATSQAISRAKRRLASALEQNPKLLSELRATMPRIY